MNGDEQKGMMPADAKEPMPVVMSDLTITADVIRQAELQVEGLNKIKSISLKVTNSTDWTVMEGKPCLQNSGCMKIAQLWGVNFLSPKLDEERRSDDRGEYITFTCSGKARFRNREVEDIGTSSTRDKLLGSKAGQLRPLADVDVQSVKKMAVTNWQSRILKKILGLSFEMRDLEAMGVKPATGTKFASGGQGGGLISEAQGKRLYALAQKGNKTDEQMKAYLKGFKYEHSKDIKREDYEKICDWAENGPAEDQPGD
jgi:hypothetical protein